MHTLRWTEGHLNILQCSRLCATSSSRHFLFFFCTLQTTCLPSQLPDVASHSKLEWALLSECEGNL